MTLASIVRKLRVPHSHPAHAVRLGIALCATALLATAHAHAQGCAQCLDSTRATPPSVQAAYRHAIYLLGGAGATLFAAATLLLRRHR
jgi:hypothetical protein